MTQAAIHLGTMNFGARTPAQEATRLVHHALDRGITHFDTANMYNDGESERILGDALKGRREGAFIATKVGLFKREGLSKERILAAADDSLKRLGTDRIDLYYLHAPDPRTPFNESLSALQALLESGKIRSWGVSNFASWQIGDLNALCDARGMARPTHSQVLYNLLIRQLDLEYVAFARAHPIHTTVYNPLAGGLLARAPKAGAAIPPGSRFATNPMYPNRYWSAALIELAGRYADLARSEGIDRTALAYAWLAGHSEVRSVLCGPGSMDHWEAALTGCALELPSELRNRIDQIHRAFLGTDASYAR